MSSTNSATQFPDPMDPTDVLDYVADFSQLLQSGETITGFVIELGANALARGVEVLGSPAPALINSNMALLFWLSVDIANQEDDIWCDNGVAIYITITLNTTTSPRAYQRTFSLIIKQL